MTSFSLVDYRNGGRLSIRQNDMTAKSAPGEDASLDALDNPSQQLMILADIQLLHQRCQHHVAQHNQRQIGEVDRRQRTQPQRRGERREGQRVTTAMPSIVSSITGRDARLWMNGSFFVRIMCMTSVCVHMDSRTSRSGTARRTCPASRGWSAARRSCRRTPSAQSRNTAAGTSQCRTAN